MSACRYELWTWPIVSCAIFAGVGDFCFVYSLVDAWGGGYKYHI